MLLQAALPPVRGCRATWHAFPGRAPLRALRGGATVN